MARALRHLLQVLLLACALPWTPVVLAAPAPVLVLQVDGAIGPATADYLHRGLAQAERRHAQLLVLELDTPGGLDLAMRRMIKDILASPVPVATFVAPGGARAASAGTYILYASHVAAMTPASNLGAATPVAIGLPGTGAPSNPLPPARPASGASAPAAEPHGDAMEAKRTHDASAYIRSLAQLRGRNAAWGEQAVRQAVSLSAPEALKLDVVDLIATDLDDLLRQLDGRRVEVAGGTRVLATRGAPVVRFDEDWRSRLLSAITNPSFALLLMMVGFYGLIFEFSSPGWVAPGVLGAICLLLALYGLQMLPVNYAGLALIVLGIGFMVAEVFLPSFGALGIGGVAAFAFGSVILIDSDSPGWGIPLPVIGGLALLSLAFVLVVVSMAARARRRPVVSGTRVLLGALGEVVEIADGEGWALVQGVHWRVHGPPLLKRGDRVRVTGTRESVLDVEAA